MFRHIKSNNSGTAKVKIVKNERDSVSQNVLKFDQQLTGEERRIPFIFDDFHF
jgi:hypothetical protein